MRLVKARRAHLRDMATTWRHLTGRLGAQLGGHLEEGLAQDKGCGFVLWAQALSGLLTLTALHLGRIYSRGPEG